MTTTPLLHDLYYHLENGTPVLDPPENNFDGILDNLVPRG
jgi:hypothetical protein